MKLSRGLDLHRAADATTTAGSADPQTVASSIPQQLKGGSDPMDGLLVFSEDRSDSGHTQTSYASSAAGKEEYRIPPLPTAASIGPFECPFCYRIITATSTASWKSVIAPDQRGGKTRLISCRRHVHEDLRPYICLEKDCLAPEKEFPRRHQWMNHMKQSHWSTYTCPASCGATFPSVSACQEHIAQRHLGAYQASEIGVLIRLGAKPLGLTEGISCPLCRDLLRSAQQYQHHVGRHQEQLALFALPIVEMDDEVVAQAEVVDGSEESTVSSKAALNIEALEVESVVRSLEKDVSTNNQAAADNNPEEAQHSPAPSPTFDHESSTPSTNEIQQKALDPSPSEYIRRPIQDHAGDESDEVLITPDRAIAQILGESSYVTKQLADQKHQPAPVRERSGSRTGDSSAKQDTATSPKIEDIVSVLNKIRVPEEGQQGSQRREELAVEKTEAPKQKASLSKVLKKQKTILKPSGSASRTTVKQTDRRQRPATDASYFASPVTDPTMSSPQARLPIRARSYADTPQYLSSSPRSGAQAYGYGGTQPPIRRPVIIDERRLPPGAYPASPPGWEPFREPARPEFPSRPPSAAGRPLPTGTYPPPRLGWGPARVNVEQAQMMPPPSLVQEGAARQEHFYPDFPVAYSRPPVTYSFNSPNYGQAAAAPPPARPLARAASSDRISADFRDDHSEGFRGYNGEKRPRLLNRPRSGEWQHERRPGPPPGTARRPPSYSEVDYDLVPASGMRRRTSMYGAYISQPEERGRASGTAAGRRQAGDEPEIPPTATPLTADMLRRRMGRQPYISSAEATDGSNSGDEKEARSPNDMPRAIRSPGVHGDDITIKVGSNSTVNVGGVEMRTGTEGGEIILTSRRTTLSGFRAGSDMPLEEREELRRRRRVSDPDRIPTRPIRRTSTRGLRSDSQDAEGKTQARTPRRT